MNNNNNKNDAGGKFKSTGTKEKNMKYFKTLTNFINIYQLCFLFLASLVDIQLYKVMIITMYFSNLLKNK